MEGESANLNNSRLCNDHLLAQLFFLWQKNAMKGDIYIYFSFTEYVTHKTIEKMINGIVTNFP